MATLTVFSSAGDGYCSNTGTSYSTVHDATAGNSTPYTNTTIAVANQKSGDDYSISRAFLVFDTSSLGAGATINSASLFFYAVSVINQSGDESLRMFAPTTQNSPNLLVNEDYDQCVGNDMGNPNTFSLVSIILNSYNEWPIVSSGLININKTGNTLIGIKTQKDTQNTTPTEINQIYFSASEETGTSQDPKLVIDYTVATTTSTTTTTSTSSTSSSTTKTDTTTTTSTTTTSTSSTSSSTSSTSSSTSSTSTSTSSTSSSTTSTSSSTTMPFSLAVDNV